MLRERARLLQSIRAFFSENNSLEVETPLLDEALIADPFFDPFVTRMYSAAYAPGEPEVQRFLSPSPESHMKRLLSLGSGDIFQICKAFRNGELGHLHHPEFTILEWYRVGWKIHALMDEIEHLLRRTCAWPPFQRTSYRALFHRATGLDPVATSITKLRAIAYESGMPQGERLDAGTQYVEWIFGVLVEPTLVDSPPTFVHNFPAEQAALATISTEDPSTANRFELYYKGMELANGFQELQDAEEQRKRCEKVLQERELQHKPPIPLPTKFLQSLVKGLPACSGVAVGLDRLLMIQLHQPHIAQVLAFSEHEPP